MEAAISAEDEPVRSVIAPVIATFSRESVRARRPRRRRSRSPPGGRAEAWSRRTRPAAGAQARWGEGDPHAASRAAQPDRQHRARVTRGRRTAGVAGPVRAGARDDDPAAGGHAQDAGHRDREGAQVRGVLPGGDGERELWSGGASAAATAREIARRPADRPRERRARGLRCAVVGARAHRVDARARRRAGDLTAGGIELQTRRQAGGRVGQRARPRTRSRAGAATPTGARRRAERPDW